MSVLILSQTKQWLKQSRNPLAKRLFRLIKAIRSWELPAPGFVAAPLYTLFCGVRDSVSAFSRVFFWTPLFKGRVHHHGRNLYLYGGLPYVTGPVEISLGDDCRISGHSTISGRGCAPRPPELRVGNNVDIGWMTTIAVGRQVTIGDNVRIAGRTLLAGYPGHPLNAQARAAGLPETDDQVGDIVLESDVWLATGVSVTAGVRIGQGTIVAAGSVVTGDLPPNVLAGGVPARVIRPLETSPDNQGQQ